MKEKIIKFNSINNARMFIASADKCDFDIDIQYNHLVIDGKSLIAILNLDLSKPIRVKYAGFNKEFEGILDELAENA